MTAERPVGADPADESVTFEEMLSDLTLSVATTIDAYEKATVERTRGEGPPLPGALDDAMIALATAHERLLLRLRAERT